MEAPGYRDLYEAQFEKNGYVSVWRESADTWRHGYRITEVFRREADGTFWKVYYRLSTDGDYNGLRDHEPETTLIQVYPREVTTTEYFEAGL